MRWPAKQRQLFIARVLGERGFINRRDLMNEFEVSAMTASLDIKRYTEDHPTEVVYCDKRMAFCTLNYLESLS